MAGPPIDAGKHSPPAGRGNRGAVTVHCNVTVTPTKGILSGSNTCKASVFGNYWGTAVATTHDQTVNDMETDGYIQMGNYYADEERDDE